MENRPASIFKVISITISAQNQGHITYLFKNENSDEQVSVEKVINSNTLFDIKRTNGACEKTGDELFKALVKKLDNKEKVFLGQTFKISLEKKKIKEAKQSIQITNSEAGYTNIALDNRGKKELVTILRWVENLHKKGHLLDKDAEIVYLLLTNLENV